MVEAAREAGANEVQLVGTPIAKEFLSTPVTPLSPRLQSIIYAGRLAPEKNLDMIMEAVENLPHIRFRIAGDGPLRRRVEAQAQQSENLEYLGWISRKEVMTALDTTDMLVLPSKIESFGTIALEAMARRRPVLLSPGCGILNWPSLARGIFQISPEETLTEAIRRIVGLDDRQRREMVSIGHNSAKAFNTETLERWFDVFRRIMRQPQYA
jgi:glycosyltransferase involved in cell wall biosynthesis